MDNSNTLNGFILLNKPKGINSSNVCIKVREILKAKKAGHAGTLDPNVTGLLIIAINDSTKLMSFLNKLNKEYIGKSKFHKEITLKDLEDTIKKFIGKIKQLPPRKSHVKREERMRNVYDFKILSFNNEKREFTFYVKCEAGTYIRKLIHDIGEKIGGAHMIELSRTKQGPFSIKESITLEKLDKSKIIKDKDILNTLK